MTKPIDEKDLENVQGGDGDVYCPTNDIRVDRPVRPKSTQAGGGGLSIPPDANPDD